VTYLWLDGIFLLVAALVLAVAVLRAPDRAELVRRWWLPVTAAGVLLAVLTAVFDNLMIGAGLMTYDDAHLSGARVGLVPLEDFAYPLAGLLLLPALWLFTRRRPLAATRMTPPAPEGNGPHQRHVERAHRVVQSRPLSLRNGGTARRDRHVTRQGLELP